MDKRINSHKKFVQLEMSRIEKIADDVSRKKAARKLLKFHDIQTKNFQHERLIHLLITLFFAVLMFASWFGCGAAWLAFAEVDFANKLFMLICASLLVAILTVLEICYIMYYYRLENRTAKLYDLTREIYKLM